MDLKDLEVLPIDIQNKILGYVVVDELAKQVCELRSALITHNDMSKSDSDSDEDVYDNIFENSLKKGIRMLMMELHKYKWKPPILYKSVNGVTYFFSSYYCGSSIHSSDDIDGCLYYGIEEEYYSRYPDFSKIDREELKMLKEMYFYLKDAGMS